MSEEKLYMVKTDEGEFLSFSDDGDSVWNKAVGHFETDKQKARSWAYNRGGHVVTLIEEPKPLVVPEWFDKWLDAFCRQGDGYSWRGLAVGRILQQGWGKSINDSYEAFDAHWTIPHVENKQVDYVLHHKKELIVAALTGNYTVAKEKKYLVELDGLVTTDGAKQYLTKKDGKWFACRRMPGMHQDFTDEELNKAPEWAQQLDREEVTDDAD